MKKKGIMICEYFEKTENTFWYILTTVYTKERKVPTSTRSFKVEGEAGKKTL